MSIGKQTAKRIAELIIILIVLSFLTFLLMYLAPGDPAEKRLSSQGVAVTKEVLRAEQERMGLLRPFMVRYGEWLGGILHGDWGISFKDDMPVAPKLTAGLQKTTILALASLIISLIVSVPLGIASAVACRVCACRRFLWRYLWPGGSQGRYGPRSWSSWIRNTSPDCAPEV